MVVPFFSISPLAFETGITIPIDLSLQSGADSLPMPVWLAGEVLDSESLARVEGKRLLASADKDHKQVLRQFFRQQLEICLGDCCISPLRLAAVIAEALRGDIDDAFTSRVTSEIVETASRWGKLLAKSLPQMGLNANDFFPVLQNDGLLPTQAANLTIYGFLLAIENQLDEAELEEFLAGLILCDIGRIDAPEETSGGLIQIALNESFAMQSHVADGFNRLVTDETVTRSQLLMAYQHHERIDGSGYPVGIPGELIHPWAKMIAIVDTFENLTCVRSQRGMISRRRALATMRQQAGNTLDLEYFRCWESQMLEPTKV